MKKFAKEFEYHKVIQYNMSKLSWTTITTIIDKVKNEEERLYYIQKTLENSWSRKTIIQQIELNLYKNPDILRTKENTVKKASQPSKKEIVENSDNDENSSKASSQTLVEEIIENSDTNKKDTKKSSKSSNKKIVENSDNNENSSKAPSQTSVEEIIENSDTNKKDTKKSSKSSNKKIVENSDNDENSSKASSQTSVEEIIEDSDINKKDTKKSSKSSNKEFVENSDNDENSSKAPSQTSVEGITKDSNDNKINFTFNQALYPVNITEESFLYSLLNITNKLSPSLNASTDAQTYNNLLTVLQILLSIVPNNENVSKTSSLVAEPINADLIMQNTTSEKKNTNVKIVDNDTLLISEIKGKVFLPYKVSELEATLKKDKQYKSLTDLIEKKYIVPLNQYKNSVFSRYKETFKLMRDREKSSLFQAINLGIELSTNSLLNPAVISACKNLNELNIYLDYLENDEIEQFDIFKIRYEMLPTATTN